MKEHKSCHTCEDYVNEDCRTKKYYPPEKRHLCHRSKFVPELIKVKTKTHFGVIEHFEEVQK